ncbi:MAG: ester cyclase [Chloroflexota bacterium]
MTDDSKAKSGKASPASTKSAVDNANKTERQMPPDYTISLDTYARGGTDNFLLTPTKRIQSMQGFEDQYTDIIDYIVRITHHIWEEGNIGYIYDTYAHNSRVYDDYGLQYGRDKIVADTVHTINAFPDIRLFADDVIWAGDDQTGFHTSHRTILSGHNTGFSRYGAPTGRKMVVTCIANCVARENEIFEEHVIYNTASMLKQLGFNLFDLARKMAPVDTSGLNDPRFGEPTRLPGQGKPASHTPKNGKFDVEDFLREMYHNVWNRRGFNHLNKCYASNVRYHGSTDREFHTVNAIKSFNLSIMAMFPDLAMQIDDIYWMGNDDQGYRVSVRWSIVGTHRGNGIYGPPTGRQAYMWGISQHIIKNERIVEEWTLFNEFALMQQLLGKRA